MPPKPAAEIHATVNPFTARDVAAILRERGWLRDEHEAVASGRGLYLFTLNPEGKPVVSWMGEAAAMLGPRAETREELVRLLALIFEYDAREVLASRECQEVLAREGARQVLRALTTEILKGGPVDSNRLKEIVASIKATLPYSSREIFHPLRVAITGRVGGGALDRVVLLLDRAAHTEGLAPVKSVRTRILEFCAALD
jgi:Anticodon binding domain